MDRPLILAVSTGCPCGIGLEVTLGAVRTLRSTGELEGVRLELYGDAFAFERMSVESNDVLQTHVVSHSQAHEVLWGKPSPQAGESQFLALEAALTSVLESKADALVTAPVSKSAIVNAGHKQFIGHTEHLQQRTNSPSVVMCFAGPRLTTSLVTTHHAIANVPERITHEAVFETIRQTVLFLRDDLAVSNVRVVVTGLNPHAGENGLFGREEIDQISPAIQRARALFKDVSIVGPMAAEAAFRQARDGAWDGVVAMYHDQATIASKLLDFGDAVNVTLGLPIIRTSVDHGTGYDIAGTQRADASGMCAAIRLALRMVRNRRR